MSFYPHLQKQGFLFEIWHPYYKWECYKNGMWDLRGINKSIVNKCTELLSDYEKCHEAMLNSINDFKYSAEHHLTKNQNKKPWVGQAACNYALGATEEETRLAWCLNLDDSNRFMANEIADKLINEWIAKNA